MTLLAICSIVAMVMAAVLPAKKKALPAGFTLIGKREGMHDVRCQDGTQVRLTDMQLEALKMSGTLPEAPAVAVGAPAGPTFDQAQYSRALAQANDKIDLLTAQVTSLTEAVQSMVARVAAIESEPKPEAQANDKIDAETPKPTEPKKAEKAEKEVETKGGGA